VGQKIKRARSRFSYAVMCQNQGEGEKTGGKKLSSSNADGVRGRKRLGGGLDGGGDSKLTEKGERGAAAGRPLLDKVSLTVGRAVSLLSRILQKKNWGLTRKEMMQVTRKPRTKTFSVQVKKCERDGW